MSDEQTTETTTPANAPPADDAPTASNEELCDAFGLGGISADDADPGPPPDTEPGDPPAAVEGEVTTDPNDAPPADEPPPGESKSDTQKRQDRLFAGARKKEQAAERTLAEAKAMQQQTQQLQQQLQQQQQQMEGRRHALELWGTNPAAALRETAKLVGGDPATMYRNLTERQLADGGIGPHEADDRFATMQQDFDQKLAALRQEQQQTAVTEKRDGYERQYKSIVVEHSDAAAFGAHWPTLGEMPPEQFEPRLFRIMNEHIAQNPGALSSTPKFLDMLEKEEANLKGERAKRRAAIQGSADPGSDAESGEGAQAPRDPDSRPAGKKTRSGGRKNPITNATAAEAGVAGKPMSDKARSAYVESYFRDHELGG